MQGELIRLRNTILLVLGSLLIGIGWFFFIEGYPLVDSFFMTVITVSTVGFGEVHPLSPAGKIFTSCYILLNIGIFAHALSAFTYFIIEGEIFKKMTSNLMEKSINELNQHIIVCGYGRYGREVSIHFLKHRQPFVLIELSHEVLEEIRNDEHKFLYIEGDATQDETLIKAGIRKASALIAALPDDSDNVFVVLTARQLNPRLNIISRAYQSKSIKKLQLAGADHVIMPEQIGGFYMATLVNKPNAVEFFTYITNENLSDIGFEEVSNEDLPDHCRGKSIRELHIRRETGTNIIGYQAPSGHYVVNPPPDTVLEPGSSFFVIGNTDQLEKFRERFKNPKE